jgi:hypothetical protein
MVVPMGMTMTMPVPRSTSKLLVVPFHPSYIVVGTICTSCTSSCTCRPSSPTSSPATRWWSICQ